MRGEAVVSAHRGGPTAVLPENALATIAATLDQLPQAIVEVDVQQSADGVLFLFHDDHLDRKTSGTGPVQAQQWQDMAALRLRDRSGALTDHPLPRLDRVLDYLVQRRAVAQLDIKRGVDFAAVVAAVRAAGAERNVIIITYRDEDALTVARLAPELMLSVTLRDGAQADRLMAAGARGERLLGWTGTRAPDAALFAALRERGIEPLFGTLGSTPESFDARWLADGDASEFAALEKSGAVMVATGRAGEVAAALGSFSCQR